MNVKKRWWCYFVLVFLWGRRGGGRGEGGRGGGGGRAKKSIRANTWICSASCNHFFIPISCCIVEVETIDAACFLCIQLSTNEFNEDIKVLRTTETEVSLGITSPMK